MPAPDGVSGPAARCRTALGRAWAADDVGDAVEAVTQRLVAAWSIRLVLREGSTLNGNQAADWALLAELLRRAGEFEQAIGAARRGLAASPPPGVGALLWFQLELAGAEDDSRHHIGEAIAGLGA